MQFQIEMQDSAAKPPMNSKIFALGQMHERIE